MIDLLLLEKLNTAPGSSFHELDHNKSKRMGGVKTLYIPCVLEVAETIRSIPKGQTRTIEDLRTTLAKLGNAETACPAKTIKYWKWMANLSEDLQRSNPAFKIPWWRVLKDGKASRHMPGGTSNHLQRLKSEGVNLMA